jgi:hypothetical protein
LYCGFYYLVVELDGDRSGVNALFLEALVIDKEIIQDNDDTDLLLTVPVRYLALWILSKLQNHNEMKTIQTGWALMKQ